MKQDIQITSTESLDTAVAEVVRLKIKLTALKAEMEIDKADVEKSFAGKIRAVNDDIAARETDVQLFCTANRSVLFADKKSRDSLTAVYGFEWTPFRVEPLNRKIKIGDIIKRLMRLPWGKAYIRHPAPQLDKEALLKDREKLSAIECIAAGITFEHDEQFFLRPKSEVAADTVKEAA